MNFLIEKGRPLKVDNKSLWLYNVKTDKLDSNMEYVVDASKKTKKFIEALMPSIIKQLKLENSTKAVVIRVANECDDNNGITVDLSGITGCYMVVIKPTRNLKDMGLTLAHEMVHVKQMAKGVLKSTKTGAHLWKGKRYSKKTEYLNMPWEVQAFSQQELILRRAIEE